MGLGIEVCKPYGKASTDDSEANRFRYGGVGRWMHPAVRQKKLSDSDEDAGSVVTPNVNFFGTYNSVIHQLPLLNLLAAFFGGRSQGTTWPQLALLLENISIVSALMLALVITFHSAFTFDEVLATDERFAFNDDGPYRVVNKLEIGDSYAQWWKGGLAGQNGGTRITDCSAGAGHPDCKGRASRVSEDFNGLCLVSECMLTLSLLCSVLILSTGGITSIGRPSVNPASHQYRRVMESYMQSVRIIILVTIMALLGGLLAFFQLVKVEIFMKFPDRFVELHQNSGAFPANPVSTMWGGSIYGFANATVVFFTFFPLFVLGWILSAGQRAVNTFPVQPFTDFLEPESERNYSRAALTDFLVKTCRLSQARQKKSNNKSGSDSDSEETKAKAYQEYIFLNCAGGARSSDAEVIADCLYDAGIRTVQELILFVKTGNDEIYNVCGISMAAASQIIWAVSFELDEVWYSEPQYPAYFSAKSGSKDADRWAFYRDKIPKYEGGPFERYTSDSNQNHENLKRLSPVQNKITAEERAVRRTAQTGFVTQDGDLVDVGAQLTWNGYLCEYVPTSEYVLTPTAPSIRPFAEFQKKNRNPINGEELSAFDKKRKKAWVDWGIVIVDEKTTDR